MPKITTPVEGFNGIVVGVTFTKGEGETDNPAALAYFERQGYTVEGAGETGYPEGDPTDKWTKDQLTAFAEAKSINVDDAKTKADLLAAVTAKPSDTPDGTTSADGGNADGNKQPE